jgi:uncharacterized protein
MFGLPKLLVLVGLIALVWYGSRWLRRWQRLKARHAAAQRPRLAAEEMRKCPACGVYVAAAGAGDCGRTDCPYRAR